MFEIRYQLLKEQFVPLLYEIFVFILRVFPQIHDLILESLKDVIGRNIENEYNQLMSQQQYKTLFEDKDVLINQNEVQIKCYFFPTTTSKIIPFSKIKHVEYGGLDLYSGGGRLWGMGIGKWGYWFAGDAQRMSRNHYIAIHTNSSVKKAFTTENDRQVYELIYKLWKEYQNKHQNVPIQQSQQNSSAMIQKQK